MGRRGVGTIGDGDGDGVGVIGAGMIMVGVVGVVG